MEQQQMKQDRVQSPPAALRKAQSSKGVKGDMWNQQDIKKRHQRFIEEENSKRAKQNIDNHWNSYLNDEVPQVRSPIASLNFGTLKSHNNTSTDFIPTLSSHKNIQLRDKTKSFHFYTSRNNASYEEPSFLRKRNKEDVEVKELLEAISLKDATIRKLKTQNYHLKSQLKTQLKEIQTQSQTKLSEQQNLIKALHEELKQLMEPKGVTVEGRSFYAEELERQMASLENRLGKAESANQELENIITSLYSENNGGGLNLSTSFGSSRLSARSKILECLAILENN